MQHEIIANNLANLNSPGFKRSLMSFEVRSLRDVGSSQNNNDMIGTTSVATHVDFSQGPVRSTGQPLDVAIQGDGFFSIQSPQGILYTRNGAFRLADSGELITADGLPVLGNGGPIQIPNNVATSQINIEKDGTIYADRQRIGKLDIVRFEDPSQLEQVGATRFRAPHGLQEEQADQIVVQQGLLEFSNSIAVTEMIRMITGMRHFESAQQTLRAISEAIQQNTNMDS